MRDPRLRMDEAQVLPGEWKVVSTASTIILVDSARFIFQVATPTDVVKWNPNTLPYG